ncbi:MAG: DUF5110 domain-containing protein [Prolixibacteraceae bacterium]|jgi:alpha-glucosidase (family GH31 glycosyl hydrolase)|nr:DUF5110 domain-containing protein [Prolixibacteraceae bacterium]
MKNTFIILILMMVASFGYARSVYEVKGNDVIINLDGFGVKSNLLKIELWNENTVRVVSTMNDKFQEYPEIIGKRSTEDVKFKVAYAQTDIEITTSRLFISIEEKGMVRLFCRDGRKMMVESDRSFSPVDGEDNKFAVAQRFFLNRREYIYGFGQDNEKMRFDLRDGSFKFVQDDVSVAMPVMISEKGYAFIWDNYSKTQLNDTPAAFSLSSEYETEISYFFIIGPEWNTLIDQVQSISGRATLLPYEAYRLPLSNADGNSGKTVEMLKAKNIQVEQDVFNYDFLDKEKAIYKQSAGNKEYQNVAAFLELRDAYRQSIDNNSEKRQAIATHINFPGIQQYNTVSVAGDVAGSWDALRSQVAAGITASFSGQTHWATNIGGVSAPSANAAELFTRWCQFAAFTPVMQVVPFDKGGYNIEENGEHFNSIVDALALRLKLMPYIYSAAANAVLNHDIIMRSLLFDYQDQQDLKIISNQYLLGASLMVCPVTVSGANEVKVTLPKGNGWYNFFTGKKQAGGKGLNIKPTISKIPLFVKEGAIIPMAIEDEENTFEIRIYGGADGSFVFYADEKDGNGYQNGSYSTISFDYSEKRKTLSIGSASGDFPGIPEKYTFRIVIVDEQNGIGSAQSAKYEEVNYEGKRVRVKF